jgi:hypothetical protein
MCLVAPMSPRAGTISYLHIYDLHGCTLGVIAYYTHRTSSVLHSAGGPCITPGGKCTDEGFPDPKLMGKG